MAQKDNQEYKTPLAHRICDRIELPEDVCRNCSRMEITSNCCAVIEGCKSVMEYDDTFIKLNLGKNAVCFSGNGLAIKSLSMEQAVIEGFIVSIEFCN
jgi:sporulation protein YqfC